MRSITSGAIFSYAIVVQTKILGVVVDVFVVGGGAVCLCAMRRDSLCSHGHEKRRVTWTVTTLHLVDLYQLCIPVDAYFISHGLLCCLMSTIMTISALILIVMRQSKLSMFRGQIPRY